jgi:hypothetical protein
MFYTHELVFILYSITEGAKKVGATRGGKEGTKGNIGSKKSRWNMRRERRYERKYSKQRK